MTPAAEIEIIKKYIEVIRDQLGLDEAPSNLDRNQIARVAGLKNARSLAASLHRGIKREQNPKWLEFRSVIGQGLHRVPTPRVARWLAAADGWLPSGHQGQPQSAVVPEEPEPTLEAAWRGIGAGERAGGRRAHGHRREV